MRADEIMESCLRTGACLKAREMAEGVRGWKDLSSLLFRSQSREYCVVHKFPTLDMFRSVPPEVRDYGIYVDAGGVRSCKRNTALIGNTVGTVVADGTDHIFKVVVMHGAKATVHASNYAVVHVAMTDDASVEADADSTSYIFFERH